MQIKEMLLWLPVLVYVLWIFAAPVPEKRIENACQPIHWIGNLTTSTTALSAGEHTATAERWSDKLNYSCQYMIWRLFYQKDYNAAVEAGLIEAEPTATGSTVTAPADSTIVIKHEEAPANQEGTK